MTTLNLTCPAGGDDGYGDPGGTFSNNDFNTNLTVSSISGRRVFFRFTATIPQGATINSASLSWIFTNFSTGTLNVAADDADNSAQPTNAADIQGRTLTSSVSRSVTGDSSTRATADVAAPLQTVVNRGGWSSGNAVMFVVTGTADIGAAQMTEFGQFQPGSVPKLDIDYTVATGASRPVQRIRRLLPYLVR